MKDILGKLEWERIFLTGAEIYTLYKRNNKKFIITYDDGNRSQRDYIEWSDERVVDYENSIIKNNFPHSPFYVLEPKKNIDNPQWYVVDGQHRMLTIIKIIQEKSSNLDQELFEIIKIKSKYSDKKEMDEFVEQSNKIFFLLNDKSESVPNGDLYKSLFYARSTKDADELSEMFKNHFQKPNKTLFRKEIFAILANAAFLIYKKEEIKKVGSMKKDIIKFLENENQFNKNIMNKLKNIIHQFKKEKVFLNKPPKNTTLYVSFLIADFGNGIKQIIKTKDFIKNLEKNNDWRESKKNTRSPEKLYWKFVIMNEANNKDEMDNLAKKYLGNEDDFDINR